ncbi:SET domain-containing protein SmydA-8-like [Arctopsyche grandis]|uniref:SET domain-containing protein SmydA-8-like n=1 Tax=Arctopsyche grandis TaxID=121162 RepID=UPI00406D791E
MNGVKEDFPRCAVCSEPAAQVCGGCRSQHYCGKVHQKQAWRSGHRFKCSAFRLECNEVLGRHLIATRDIKQGEMIFKEKPAVLGPKIVSHPVCLSCYKRVKAEKQQNGKIDFYKCTSCGWPMCNSECQSSKVHKEECELMNKRKYTCTITYGGEDKKESAYCVIAPLRCLLMEKTDPKQYEAILSMQGHLEQRINTPLYKILKANIVTFIQQVLGFTQFDENTIMNVAAILDNNAFDYRYKNLVKLRGLYLTASMQSHDCVPNTKHVFLDEDYHMAVIATLPITKGSVITTSYTQPLRGTLTRRIHLQNSKCFSCTCSRCADPTELGTYLGSIFCSICRANSRGKDSKDIPKMMSTNPLDSGAEWKCNVCGHQVQAKQMTWGNEAILKDIRILDKTNPKDLEEYIIKYEQALHPSNYHVIDVKLLLTQMYGWLPGFTYSELNIAALDRKISLCEEILDVLNILQPGHTRGRGEILLELQSAMLVKTKRDLATDKITKDAAQGLMGECMAILQEASDILKSEPDMQDILRQRLQALSFELND